MTSESIPGYHGCYLRIDLTTGASRSVELREETLRNYLGGSGLGVAILLAEGSATVEPLSPAATIAFVFSPLVGSPLTTSAKFAVVSKSPLTERINDSLASSSFALAGKKTGHDAIVLVGRAAEPSILVIEEETVRLEAAGELWGLPNGETQSRIRERLGNEFQVASIGPAGERLVRFATISHDGRHAGRGQWGRFGFQEYQSDCGQRSQALRLGRCGGIDRLCEGVVGEIFWTRDGQISRVGDGVEFVGV